MPNKYTQIENIVDKNQSRLYSGFLALLLGGYLFTSNEIFLYIVVYDLFAKIYITSQISPLYLISTYLIKIVSLKNRVADAYAKEFDSHIGLTLLFIALIADFLNETKVAFLLIVFLFLCKIVEVTNEFCFACKFYEFLKSAKIEVESL